MTLEDKLLPDPNQRPTDDDFFYLPTHNPDGTEQHIVKSGARYHVTHYDRDGEHCSESNCEINKHGSYLMALANRNQQEE